MTPLDDATTLVAGYRAGTHDPLRVAEQHLARIARLDQELNAYSAQAGDVLEEARASRDRWAGGRPKGPLDGVPVIIKDNLVSAGLPAAWGNAELARRVPRHDERPVAALREAGAIILGKGNTPEFAVEGYTGNATFGITGNPFAPGLTPGGSSGGVVAAVAAGMAVAGLGTDGGGSIRRPAGYTGLWGLKPGIGTVPRGQGLPQVLLDFETVGPLTRSARDLALFHKVLSPGATAAPLRPLRILAVARIGKAPCDPGILAQFEGSAEQLASLGHEVIRGALPLDLDPLNEVWARVAEIGLAHLGTRDAEVLATAAPKYREMASRGACCSAVDLYEALIRVFAMREAVRGLWGHDAILMPTAAAPPWAASEPYPPHIAGQTVGPRGHAVYTGWVNASGLPALAFPAGLSRGLPVGMQLIANHGGETLLLSLAKALQMLSNLRGATACSKTS